MPRHATAHPLHQHLVKTEVTVWPRRAGARAWGRGGQEGVARNSRRGPPGGVTATKGQRTRIATVQEAFTSSHTHNWTEGGGWGPFRVPYHVTLFRRGSVLFATFVQSVKYESDCTVAPWPGRARPYLEIDSGANSFYLLFFLFFFKGMDWRGVCSWQFEWDCGRSVSRS